jgi:predicted ATPase
LRLILPKAKSAILAHRLAAIIRIGLAESWRRGLRVMLREKFGLVEQSVSCWALAGRRSVLRSATAEAAAQFQKGLEQDAGVLLAGGIARHPKDFRLRMLCHTSAISLRRRPPSLDST